MAKKLSLFGYVRVSTKGQIKAPGGISAQKDDIQKWCALHKHEMVKVCSDPGVSSIDKRPSFERMIKTLKEGKADGVVVTKLDRFGRSVQDLVLHINELRERKQHFISIGDNIDTSTTNGRLMFHILAAFAEFERETIRERMKAGRERAEAMGKVTHRPRSKLIDPEELKRVEELYKKGVGVSSLAKIFNVSRPTMRTRLDEMGLA